MNTGKLSAKYKKQKLSSDVLAEILRSDDEDELVEFIKKSFPQNGVSNNKKRPTRASNRARSDEVMHEVDLTTENTASHSQGNISTYDLSSNGESIIVGERPRNSFRICLTFALFVSFFALGIGIAILGPSLLDLGEQVHAPLNQMSTVFTARSVGYLIGSLLAGWLLDKWNGYVVITLSCFVAVLTLIIVPLTHCLLALIITLICKGLALGALDTGGNVILLDLYGKTSDAQMQALHAMFGLGAFVAPILVEPFLNNHNTPPTDGNLTTITNQSHINQSNMYTNHSIMLSNHSVLESHTATDMALLKWPFWISALCFVVPMVIFVSAIIKNERPKQHAPKTWDTMKKEEWKAFRGFSLVLLFIFLLLYVGMEVAIGGLIFTFALKHGIFESKSSAAYLTSTFWGSFCVARFLGIPLAMYAKPFVILIFDMTGCLLGALLLVFVSNSVPALLWIGTCILGMSMASVFPSTMTWADTFMHVTAKAASIMVVGAAFGEMTIPLVIGTLMEKKGYATFLQAILVVVVLAILVFIAITIISKRQQREDIERFGIHYKRAAEPKGNHSRFSKGDEIVQLLEDSSEIFSTENLI